MSKCGYRKWLIITDKPNIYTRDILIAYLHDTMFFHFVYYQELSLKFK